MRLKDFYINLLNASNITKSSNGMAVYHRKNIVHFFACDNFKGMENGAKFKHSIPRCPDNISEIVLKLFYFILKPK